jgi:hypothetical protein
MSANGAKLPSGSLLQCYLTCWMIKLRLLQPVQIPHRPALLAWIDATMLEHGGTYLLPVNPHCLDSCRAGVNEISHSFMAFVRNPNRSELAGPQKPGGRKRIRRFVFTRSPGFLGINEEATTMQLWPSERISR